MNVVLSSFCVLNLVSVMPARVPPGGWRCPRCEMSFQSTRGIAAHAARVHLCYFRGAGGVPVLVDIPADQVPQALMRVRVNAVHARRRPGLRARLERELAAGGWPGPGRHQAGHPAMAAACSGPTSSSPPEHIRASVRLGHQCRPPPALYPTSRRGLISHLPWTCRSTSWTGTRIWTSTPA